MRPPLICNLFPWLAGPVPRWLEHARRLEEVEALRRAGGRVKLERGEVCYLVAS